MAVRTTGVRFSTANTERARLLATLAAMELDEVQQLMADIFGEGDAARGLPASVAWLAEEVGELAQAIRKGTVEQQLHELGDVLAWTASLANQLGLRLDDAVQRYARGCPRCHAVPCACGT